MEPSHQLQHDPRTKQQIKDALYAILYDPLQGVLKKRLNEIIKRNTTLGGYSHNSFMFKNVLYNNDPSQLPRRMNRLVPSLHNDMDAYLKEIKQLNEWELPHVLGYINQTLNASNALEDYLQLLPRAIHQPIIDMINSCPCRNHSLQPETVQLLQNKNAEAIDMMCSRMVKNLLL